MARDGMHRRRSISRQASLGIDRLSHAIEYLSDSLLEKGGTVNADDGQLEAVRLLTALTRQTYAECPELPTARERILSLLGIQAA